MPDITQILQQLTDGRQTVAEDLLQLVYTELQQLARAKLSNEQAGQTLQATDLVHEAYLRLTQDRISSWDSRGHFFCGCGRGHATNLD